MRSPNSKTWLLKAQVERTNQDCESPSSKNPTYESSSRKNSSWSTAICLIDLDWCKSPSSKKKTDLWKLKSKELQLPPSHLPHHCIDSGLLQSPSSKNQSYKRSSRKNCSCSRASASLTLFGCAIAPISATLVLSPGCQSSTNLSLAVTLVQTRSLTTAGDTWLVQVQFSSFSLATVTVLLPVIVGALPVVWDCEWVTLQDSVSLCSAFLFSSCQAETSWVTLFDCQVEVFNVQGQGQI